jgi:hypothetical protein
MRIDSHLFSSLLDFLIYSQNFSSILIKFISCRISHLVSEFAALQSVAMARGVKNSNAKMQRVEATLKRFEARLKRSEARLKRSEARLKHSEAGTI